MRTVAPVRPGRVDAHVSRPAGGADVIAANDRHVAGDGCRFELCALVHVLAPAGAVVPEARTGADARRRVVDGGLDAARALVWAPDVDAVGELGARVAGEPAVALAPEPRVTSCFGRRTRVLNLKHRCHPYVASLLDCD